MTPRGLQILGLAAASVLLVACESGRKNPPDTTVIVINAAASYDGLDFRRERSSAISLGYQQASNILSYDVDEYDFNVSVPTVDGSTVVTFSQQLREDTRYAFVLTDVGGVVEPVVLEYPPLEASASGAQAVLMHAAAAYGPISVYIEPPGTDLTAATPRATLAFGQAVTPLSIGAGGYEITLTEAGNPAAVLMASDEVTVGAGSTTVLVIADGADISAAQIALIYAGTESGLLYDKNTPALLRVINAAADSAPRDVALNSEFAPPLFAAVPPATPTPYVTVPAGSNTIDVTPPGNTGVSELNATITTAFNSRQTLLFAGDSGALKHAIAFDDRRRVATGGRFRVLNGATQFESLQFFLVLPGADLADATPFNILAAPSFGSTGIVPPGSYDLVVRSGENIVAGPQPVTIEAYGLYGALTINGPDTSSATLLLLEDFAAPAP